MRILFLLLFIITIQFSLEAQDAVVVLKSGEKKSGTVELAPTDRGGKSVVLKGMERQVFTAHETDSLIIGNIVYLGRIVTKDMLPVEKRHAANEGAVIVVKDTVFLKLLVSGPRVSLLHFKDEKDHFYITSADKQLTELHYRVFKKNLQSTDPTVDPYIIQNYFKNQLRQFAKGDEAAYYKIDQGSYTSASLVNLVQMINDLPDEPDLPRLIRFGMGGGFTSNSVTFKGQNASYLRSMDMKNKGGGYFKVYVDVFGKNKIHNLFMRTEAGISGYHYKATVASGINNTYQISINSKSLSELVCYQFLKNEQTNLYIGIGPGINFSNYSDNRIAATNPNNSPTIPVKRFWPEITSRAGLYWQFIAIEASYRITGTPFDYPELTNRFSTFGLGVNFFFSK